jgi:sulfite reductase (ferredoxin)
MVISSQIPNSTEKKPSKVEGIKEVSNFLREPLATELLEDTSHFSDAAVQVLKFHGSYQQDDRDNRVKGQEKDYQLMLRTRSPGGFIPAQLYLTLDKLSDEYGNGTLRTTTRQGFQLHGVLKKNLKAVLSSVIKNMGSTLGACGDLNRNVMAPPAPYKNRYEYQLALDYANKIADLLTPQTGAYYEIWLDGEKIISAEEAPEIKEARQRNHNGTVFANSEEPIYGTHYMPRKFKCAVTVPGDNSVDLYTQDLSLVVITNQAGELEGFNIFAGGGLGQTHNKEETFARAADEIGYVDKEDVYDLIKAIVATQRDYGDRFNRRHARMKYLINDWGVAKFRAKVEEYFGKSLKPFKPLPKWKYLDYLGWQEQGDGKLFVGISVENGRVKDEGSFQLKTALREIISQYQLPMLLTPHHNIIIYDILPEQQQAIQQILDGRGIKKETEIEPLVRYSMACPAMPTCGLAITESERALPGILGQIRLLLDKVGLAQEHFVTRMTGCPNGCARPYMAELGFVGSAPNAYQVWLGGSPDGTRLAKTYVDRLPVDKFEAELKPIFVYFKQERQLNESFGDFCDRVGFDAIRQSVTNYQSSFSMNTDINNQTINSIESEHNPQPVTETQRNSDTNPPEAPVFDGQSQPPVAPPANFADTPPVVPPTTTETQSMPEPVAPPPVSGAAGNPPAFAQTTPPAPFSEPTPPTVAPVEPPTSSGSVAPVEPPMSQGSVAPVEPPMSQGSVAPVEPPMSQESVAPVEPPMSQGSVAPVEPPMSQGSVAPVEPPMSQESVAPVEPPMSQESVAPVEPHLSPGSVAPVEAHLSPGSVAPVEAHLSPGSVAPVEPHLSESDSALAAQQKRDTSKMRHRVSVRDEIYTKLKEESKRQGKPVVQLATEAIAEYLENIKPDEAPVPQNAEEPSEGM